MVSYLGYTSLSLCPRISVAAKKMIAKFGHPYFEETRTYIRVFGATGAPHLLPVHVLHRIILEEIRYQTIFLGYNASLVKDKKRAFIPYGFHIGFYMLRNSTHVKHEGLNKIEYQFHTGVF